MIDALSHLLDTTALVDFAKGFEPARSRVLDLFDHGHEVALCSVTVAGTSDNQGTHRVN